MPLTRTIAALLKRLRLLGGELSFFLGNLERLAEEASAAARGVVENVVAACKLRRRRCGGASGEFCRGAIYVARCVFGDTSLKLLSPLGLRLAGGRQMSRQASGVGC
jgi:hypothetical protein